jgi:GNAT superfamily N-acetyltransferase
MPPTRLTSAQADDAVTVLCDAFYDYPVMRYVLGATGHDYDARLRTLIGMFVGARYAKDEPVLAEWDGGTVVAAAIVTLPGERPAPEAFLARREAAWRELGDAARERYAAFGAACGRFAVEAPHHHLNMIGVRRSHAGRGLARPLLEAVHAMAEEDTGSAGVSLSTENPRNLLLYEHFGYERLGHARVSDDLETWVFFRPADGRTRERTD